MTAKPSSVPEFQFHTAAMSKVRYHYNLWRLAGLWPQPSDPPALRYIANVVHFSSFVVFNVTMLASLLTVSNMDDVIETLLPATSTVGTSLKAWLVMRNRKHLQHLFRLTKRLEELGSSSDAAIDAAEQVLLHGADRSYGRLKGVMTTSCYAAITWRIVSTIWLEPERQLMWRAWFPFDWQRTTLGYRTALGFQIVCNLYIGVLYSSMDTFGPMAYGTLGSFLDVLASRLRRLGIADRSAPHGQLARRAHRALVVCVRYHTLCLEYDRCLDRLMALQYGFQFISSSLLLCSTAYKMSDITVSTEDAAALLFLMMFLLNMTLELLIPCWYGSLVRVQSERLSVAVFECGWVEMDGRFRRSMMIFVEGLRRPIVIYTWKRLCEIGLPSFVTVGRAAYSLLSCLKGNLGEEQD